MNVSLIWNSVFVYFGVMYIERVKYGTQHMSEWVGVKLIAEEEWWGPTLIDSLWVVVEESP